MAQGPSIQLRRYKAVIQAPPPPPPRYQDVFASSLINLADRDDRIVGITAAMPSGTGLDRFQKVHPQRFF